MAKAKPVGRDTKNAARVCAQAIASKRERMRWLGVLRALETAAALSLELWPKSDDVGATNRIGSAKLTPRARKKRRANKSASGPGGAR